MAGYGLLFLGPSQHLWFNFMRKVLQKRDVLTTFKKVFMGQAVYGPANATLFSPIMQLYKVNKFLFHYDFSVLWHWYFYNGIYSWLSRLSCVCFHHKVIERQ